MGILSPGVKQKECEAHHIPPFSAWIKNKWKCTSFPPICLYDMHRNKFVFTSWRGTYYSHFAYEVSLKNNAFELKKSALLFQLQAFANFLCWK
jgi:hypothetical protein